LATSFAPDAVDFTQTDATEVVAFNKFKNRPRNSQIEIHSGAIEFVAKTNRKRPIKACDRAVIFSLIQLHDEAIQWVVYGEEKGSQGQSVSLLQSITSLDFSENRGGDIRWQRQSAGKK
jgi:hypothetical protein